MEAGSEGDKKKPPEGENKSKRKMKTASQLELLENTYAVETYPSETLRAELSVKLGLTDRQLQMWFCHRRLKDRKVAPVKRPRKDSPVAAAGDEMMVGQPRNEPGSGSGSGSSPFGHGESRKVSMSRIGADIPMVKRYYEPPQSISELRAIAFVEEQLGEMLREDGPILGMEFDPLPPDAFGAPIEMMVQQQQAGRPYKGQIYERRDAKSIKTSPLVPNMEHCFVPSSSGGKRKVTAGSAHAIHTQTAARALHEYQFLPEQPSVRSDIYERVAPSHFYDSTLDGPSARASSLSSGGPLMHGNEQVATKYGFQGQASNLRLLSQQGRQDHVFSSASGEYDGVSQKNCCTNIGMDAQFGAHPIVGLENPFEPSDRRVSEDDVPRMERKRKSEEARIAREVEAHEKRIRKELEKQDILRRKREEQMRKEMEKNDRERRKEEERLMREKQREEERFQREQRREIERRERFMQKESLRAEKIRQKEELRREKEAVRLKAANERAIARRIARESMELIEDERLELMELAASSKELPSIISLDGDTLQNLELFRDMLSTFPPKSVQLKRPFAIQPWTDSEENIGNLLMVWRFLITFTDVLKLWPFTLDEFIQAFHDYDPRLLGEIHVSLMRSIIKDVEDVARTPSIGLGANQYGAANPGGGHPQIVEGAYAWGFDIRSWQRHLNLLTWPEILRQFALSAGFGPQLKKRTIERAYFRDDNEGNDGEDIVSTLRSGTAAENAVSMMREKGFSHPRRSRHRLTPGTVKFAAFHVLSLEGSKGLTILEVADKIQKSGLRDLTTSKTPEASIAAALSRDANLFERTAPSTYCVRPAFRKDPADAKAILSAAREKIQIFENGFSDGEEADDIGRDEDSECDVGEDPEVDDVGIISNSKKGTWHSNEANAAQEIAYSGNGKDTFSDEVAETPLSGLGNAGRGFSSFPSEGLKEINISGATIDEYVDVAGNCNEVSNPDQEDTEIDESNSGEPWVQGLVEGEYSDLSVEERLNALVALIGVAMEGNSIRIVLEERLEAANALKKQMWAEAQLDKRRMKEEYVTKWQCSSFMGIKAEPNLTSVAAEGSQSPLLAVDNENIEASMNPSVKQESFLDHPHNVQNYLNNLPTEKNLVVQELSAGPGPDNFPLQQPGYAAEKSRSQLKSYIGHRAEEMYVYRSLPLGQDRRRNRYWQFVTSASRNDPGSGRIFVELHDGCWRLIDSEEDFDALLQSLDTRGIRESHLHSMLQKVETSFKETVRRNLQCTNIVGPSGHTAKMEDVEMTSSPDCTVGIDSPHSTVCGLNSDTSEPLSSFRIELGRNETEKKDALKRYRDFEKWMWKECFNSSILCATKYGKKRCTQLLGICDYCHDSFLSEDNHCPSCHRNFGTFANGLNFSEHVIECEEKQKVDPDWNFHVSDSSLPLRIRLLKAQLALTEVSVPPEALEPFWTEEYRKSWGMKLHASSSAEDLLQIMTLLEGVIKQDCLSSNFETTNELLRFSTLSTTPVEYSSHIGLVPVLPWVPQTTAAVALRLMELDASISYMLHQKVESHREKEAGDFIKLPSRYAVVQNILEVESAETPDQAEYGREENWVDPGSRLNSSGRGRGGRGRGRGRSRGGRWQRGVSGSRSEFGKENIRNSEIGNRLRTKARSRGRGRKRGRRTVRNRQKLEKKVVVKETVLGHFGPSGSLKQSSSGASPRSSDVDEWAGKEIRMMQMEGADRSNSGEASESDESGQATGDEYEDRGADGAAIFRGKSVDLLEESDEDMDGNEDGDSDEEGDGDQEIEDDGEEGEEVGELSADSDGEGNGDEDGVGNRDGDDDTASASSGYSD